MPTAALTADEFTAAFARHGRTLWVVAAAWVGRSDAADLVQESARIAWQTRAQFVSGSDLAAWLCQIVRHTGANWRRKRRPAATDPHDLPEAAAPASPHPSPTTFAGLRDDLPDALVQKLEQLPEVARASLLLHVVAGHGFAEIATMLDIPENTATSHVRRARAFLREALAAPKAEAR
ncbi:MAG: RNA polymerase sigma factor [Planctomycetes bacterium]|nr:RNA polymerase sigma factor [Planctomycetota bacterium]